MDSVEATIRLPAAAAPSAVAASPSSWAMRCAALGATHTGEATFVPQTETLGSTTETSRSTRGRNRQRRQPVTLSATVRSSSAPPA